jgi:hypothetical protein
MPEDWRFPVSALDLQCRTALPDPPLPMTETARASVMHRKAAGHLKVVSENQSQKVGRRSAVARVDRQSTHQRHSPH